MDLGTLLGRGGRAGFTRSNTSDFPLNCITPDRNQACGKFLNNQLFDFLYYA
jgi:hypothetical protein